MKRIIIIHGWEGSPEANWFPWLKTELESKGYQVETPEMPDTNHPKIKPWISKLEKVIGKPDKDTYLIGHSIGCQAVMRYLQTLPKDAKIGGVLFVAGFVSLTPMTTREPEDKKIIRPWFETPLYFDKIKRTSNKFTALFSDNDPFVPLKENSDTYKRELGAKIVVEKGVGHFDDPEYPVILNTILELAK